MTEILQEYRVVWQREGMKGTRSRIYQTLRGAKAHAERMETARADYARYGVDVAPLLHIRIESRDVGEWVA